jgi:hypothetical protein
METVWPQINGSGIPQLKVLFSGFGDWKLLSFQVFAAKYIGLVMSADREFLQVNIVVVERIQLRMNG